jgi:hypothetical protein
MPRFPLALAPLLIAGCAAPLPDTREPLPAGRAVEFHHVSRLEPAEAHAPARASADAAEAPARVDAPVRMAVGPFVRLHCSQYQVDASSLESLVRSSGGRAFACVASRADVQRVLEARIADGSVERSARPSLLVRDGGTASMSITHQQAFVDGFEIARVGADLIGDPRIATTEEGLTLEVRARLDPAPSIGVEVAWKQTQLLRPLLEGNVRVPGSGLDVVVQVPLALRQEISSAAELGPDEVLVLGGILDGDGVHDMLVVVDARREEKGVAVLGVP